MKMKLVNSKEDILKNLTVFDRELNEESDISDFYHELVKRGKVFVSYIVGDEYRFAPSRYIGYKNNSKEKHLNNKEKSGRRTTPRIKKILGKYIADRKKSKRFIKFTRKLDIKPNGNKWKFFHEEVFLPSDENEIEPSKLDRSRMAKGGQGYSLSSKERKAVENHAMKLAKKHYENEGYQVKDTSQNNPYDLRCSNEKGTIFIEVKGSKGSNEKIRLTENEVYCAKKDYNKFELFVVSEIQIDKNTETPKARGGKHRIIKPWKPKRKCLTPIEYFYNLACHGDP